MASIAELLVRFGADTSELDKAIKDLQGNMKGVAEKFDKVGSKMSKSVTAPLTLLGGASAKAAIDFESAFAGVRKTVDTTEEGFAKLEEGILEMARVMPASAVEIAGVAEAAGQLGIKEKNILSFTETIINLGEATNLSAEQGATELARFANIVGMSQENFNRLGSSLVGLGNNFATTEAEIMSMGMRLAGQGAQIGLTESQILALATAMSSLGINAEAGGTSMSLIMSKINTAVAEGGEELANFAKVAGMSAEEFKQAFEEDAAMALDAFIKGLAKSSESGENLTSVLADLGIKGQYERDTLLRLAGASDIFSEAMEISATAWEENTALSDEAAQRYETTASQLAMLKNRLVEVGIQLGNIMIPIMLQVVEAITPLIEKFASLDERTQKIILIVGAVVAAIGPLLVIIGKVISAIQVMLPALKMLRTAFTVVRTAIMLLSGPIGWITVAVVTLATLIITNWEFVKETSIAIWEALCEWLSNLWSDIVALGETIWNGLVEFFDYILTGISDFFTNTWNSITNFLSKTWNNIKNTASRVWEGIRKTVVNIVVGIVNRIRNGFTNARNTISSILSGIRSLIVGMFNKIVSSVSNFTKTFKTIGANLIKSLWNGINGVRQWIMDKIKGFLDGIVSGIKKFFGIASPSKLFKEYGDFLGQGLAIGIEASIGDVRSSALKMSEVASVYGQPDSAQAPTFDTYVSRTDDTPTQEAFHFNFTGPIHVNTEENIRQFSREVYNLSRAASRSRGQKK